MHRSAILGVLFLFVLPARDAEACIALGHAGVVPVAGEEALIVWDEAHHLEHFVRRASFDGVSEDFGFIVPTPTRPELVEVSERVFPRLFSLYGRSAPAPDPHLRGRAIDGMRASAVTVVEESVVAGLTSTVLQATSASALDAWLAEHGYVSGPELVPWLTPYVEAGFYLTAFRVDAASSAGRPVAMRAVRMTFETDRPFFPYSEPQTAGRAARPFRVSVVAPTRMRALEGDAPWGATVGFARRAPRLSSILRGIVPSAARTGRLFITTFDEPRSVRGTRDLFFVPSEDTSAVPSSLTRRIVGL